MRCDLGALRAPRGTGAVDDLCRVGVDLAPAAVGVAAYWHHRLRAIRCLDPRVADVGAGECRGCAGRDLRGEKGLSATFLDISEILPHAYLIRIS